MATEDKTKLMRALEWLVDVNVPALQLEVDTQALIHCDKDEEALSQRVFSRAKWKASISGAATGVATNPWIAIPSAATDVLITLRAEIIATAKVALIYNPDYFDDPGSRWRLLIPVFGIDPEKNTDSRLPISKKSIGEAAFKRYFTKESLIHFQIIMVKYLGQKITQRGIFTKTVPIAGGIIGGVWNWREVSNVKRRAIDYFSVNQA